MTRAPARRSGSLAPLQAGLGYEFRDPTLLRSALAHRSYVNEMEAASSNERLEFLGDAVVQLAVSDALYREAPHLSEGELTRARAALVNRHTLADTARRLGLGEFVLLGKGARASGTHLRESILADTFEAVIAAVYLDGGVEASSTVLRRAFGAAGRSLHSPSVGKDFKSLLQELTQAASRQVPSYELVAGESTSGEFVARVTLQGRALAEGTGPTRAAAEQAAAEEALTVLGRTISPDGDQ